MVLPGYETLVPPQRSVIGAARQAGCPILFVVDTHRRNVRQNREWLKRAQHCVEGTWGVQVIEDLDPRPDNLYIVKRRHSAFFNTDLDLTLRDLQVNTVVIFGVVTNICVRSTVHDAFFLGYQVIVPEECVAATGPREQESLLYASPPTSGSSRIVSRSSRRCFTARRSKITSPAEVGDRTMKNPSAVAESPSLSRRDVLRGAAGRSNGPLASQVLQRDMARQPMSAVRAL